MRLAGALLVTIACLAATGAALSPKCTLQPLDGSSWSWDSQLSIVQTAQTTENDAMAIAECCQSCVDFKPYTTPRTFACSKW